MKKSLAALIFGLLVASGVYALDFNFSAGGGSFLNLTYESDHYTLEDDSDYEDMKTLYGTWGAWAFLDGTFLELSAGVGGSHGIQGIDTSYYEGGGVILQAAALGKFPFTANDRCVYYPLVGVDYQYLLGAMTGAGRAFPEGALKNAQDRFNALWLKLGGGIDFDITEKLYVRTNFLYGVKLYTDLEREFWESRKDKIQTYAFHGPTFRLAFGYKLFTIKDVFAKP